LRNNEKKKQPMTKAVIETKDRSQPYGFLASCPDAPSPRKIVLPARALGQSHFKFD
jgi:hypothetical protein